jgi:hypothetical protein
MPKGGGGAAFGSPSIGSGGSCPKGRRFLFLEYLKGCLGRHLYGMGKHRAKGSLVI